MARTASSAVADAPLAATGKTGSGPGRPLLRAGPEVPKRHVHGGLGERVSVEVSVEDREGLRRVFEPGAEDPRCDEVLEHPLGGLGRLAAPDGRRGRFAKALETVVA